VEAVFTALRVAEATGGAFDPTAAPLREAWARDGPPPPAKALAALRERVGVGLLSVEPARLAIAKARPDVALDLDDLGGGWLADRIASAIGALGMRHVLVDVGGEVSGRGRRADGSRWHVAAGAEGPRSTDAVVIRLDDSSVATSADDSLPPPDGSESARRRVVDPRTGSPVTHALVSATVVHPDGAWADALAAALLVLGPVEGRALVERRRLAARLVDRLPDGSRSVWSSRSFAALVE
jgi:thiamine biosynthesis lipoprotein